MLTSGLIDEHLDSQERRMSRSTSLPSGSHELPRFHAAEPAAAAADGTRIAHGGDPDGSHARARKRRNDRVRVRVNAKGAAYVEGLRCDGVYEAHIKPQWPSVVWPEGTGLSHTCFLFEGMYEIVEDFRGRRRR